jgi:hypothetical protein
MEKPDKPPRALDFQELSELRHKTEVVSKLLRDRLLAHLETLRPVLAPDRVFGRFASTRADSPLADRAFAELQQSCKPFSARPFGLPSEFDAHWLTLVGTRVTLYPWEYAYEIRTAGETRTVSMSSPVRWVVNYTSGYTLSEIRKALANQAEARPEHVRQFVINALVTQLVVAHTPGLAPLLADLRYQLQTEHVPDLPKLPLTTIASGLASFRPADDLILSATSFSGIPAFIELIDLDAVSDLQDPLKARLDELLR